MFVTFQTYWRKNGAYILLICIALALRLWEINARSLWFDEAFEYWVATLDIKDISQATLASFQPPLNSFILHYWLQISHNQIWLRMLYVSLSVGTVIGVMVWSKEVLGKSGALIAGVLIATLPTEIKYAQEVGEYALLTFTLTFSGYFLFKAWQTPRPKYWGLWALFSTLSAYSHFGSLIIIIPTTIFVVLAQVKQKKWTALKQQLIASSFASLLGIPLVTYFLPNQLNAQAPTSPKIIDVFDESMRLVTSLPKSFAFSLTGFPFTIIPLASIQILLFTIFTLAILLRFLTKNPNIKLLSDWFWTTYFFYFLLTRINWYGYGKFGFRYTLIFTPIFIILITFVIQELIQTPHRPPQQPNWLIFAKRAMGFSLFAIILTMSLLSLPNRSASTIIRRQKSLWPETADIAYATQIWLTENTDNTPTYIYNGASAGFRYYLREMGYEDEFPLSPMWFLNCQDNNPSVNDCHAQNIHYGTWVRSETPANKRLSIQNSFGGTLPEQFWVIFAHAPDQAIIIEQFSSDYMIQFSKDVTGASVYLFTSK